MFLQKVAQAFRWTVRLFGGIIGGVYLLFLYGVTIVYAVFLLSAIQVREDLRDAIPGDQAISFHDVVKAKQRFDELDVILFNSNVFPPTEYDLQIQELVERRHRLMHAIYIRVYSDFLEASQLTPIHEFDSDLFLNDPNYIQQKDFCLDEDFAFQFRQFCEDIKNVAIMNKELTQLQIARQKEYDKVSYQQRNEKYIEAREAYLASQPIIRFHEAYLWFKEYEQDFLLTIPTPILVALLTISMGGLGSAVTMTWSYVRSDSGLTVRRFVVLPFVGCMSAFIIFIFINAGQMTLTAGAGGAALNPFALSFIGIVSGLLSERAYIRISAVGANFFKVNEDQPRWASGLKAALQEDGMTAAELGRHLGMDEAEIERIAEESAAAPLPQQRLIAACMRRPLRKLFTDVPPGGDGDTTAHVIVPDLTRLPPGAYEQALVDAKLVEGARSEEASDDVPAGAVVQQSPSAGSLATPQSRVDIVVSIGPDSAPNGGDAGQA